VWGGAGVVAGDTLYVLGTVTDQKLTVGASGTNDSTRITIRGDGAQAGIIDANSSVLANACIHVNNQDYITITEITLQGTNTADAGAYNLFSGSVGGTGLIIDNVESKDGSWGGDVRGTDPIIRDSSFHDNVRGGLIVSSSTGALVQRSSFYNNTTQVGENTDGLFVGNNSTGFIVEHSAAYNNTGGDDSSGFDSSGNAAGPAEGTYRYNLSYDNDGGGFKASGDDKTEDIVYFYYNIVYDNKEVNFVIYEYVTAYLYNNSIGDTTCPDHTCPALRMAHGSQDKNVTLRNNIFWGSYPYVFIFDERYTTIDSEYNIFKDGTLAFSKDSQTGEITFAHWQSHGYDTTGSGQGDPLFTSEVEDSEDFTLQAGSKRGHQQ
jgi:hypothetical protein